MPSGVRGGAAFRAGASVKKLMTKAGAAKRFIDASGAIPSLRFAQDRAKAAQPRGRAEPAPVLEKVLSGL
jgi:hypothetical protein